MLIVHIMKKTKPNPNPTPNAFGCEYNIIKELQIARKIIKSLDLRIKTHPN